MEHTTIKNLNYLICKAHAKILQIQAEQYSKVQQEFSGMAIDTAGQAETMKQVRFDNLYDVLFNNAGQPKESGSKRLIIKGASLDFLESHGDNIQFAESFGDKKGAAAVDLEKLKISKQFKLINPLPKFQSVPATPQFFDLAGAHVAYPSLDNALAQFKVQGGLFKKITGLFGR